MPGTRSFTHGAGDAARFWDISWDDDRVEITSGKWGTNGRARTAVFESGKERDAFVAAEVAKVLRKGFVETSDVAPAQAPKVDPAWSRKAASLRTRIDGLVRPAWLPIFEAGADHPARFGSARGPMTLGPGEPWPACSRCGGPLSGLLELDLSKVPFLEAQRDALLQVFFCETWERENSPDVCTIAGGVLARYAPRDGRRNEGPPGLDPPSVPSSIVGWTETRELPNLDLSELAETLDEADPAVIDLLLRSAGIVEADFTTLAELDGGDLYERMAEKLGVPPLYKHKLGGYPTFAQEQTGQVFAHQIFQIEHGAPFGVNLRAGHVLAARDGSIHFFHA